MSISNWLVGVTGLGDGNPDIKESLKEPNFNNYSYSLTITIKGSHSLRNLEDDLKTQYKLFKRIVNEIIDKHSSQYFIAFELHKCGSWIHCHGIFNPIMLKSIKQIKQEVFLLIEKQPIKKGQSYKRRIDIQKVYSLDTWIPYILKDELSIHERYSELKQLFKLKKIKPPDMGVVTFGI